MEITQMSFKRWMDMWYLYITEYYSAIKENEMMPFEETWMDLEIILIEEKYKYLKMSLRCAI